MYETVFKIFCLKTRAHTHTKRHTTKVILYSHGIYQTGQTVTPTENHQPTRSNHTKSWSLWRKSLEAFISEDISSNCFDDS